MKQEKKILFVFQKIRIKVKVNVERQLGSHPGGQVEDDGGLSWRGGHGD